MTFSSHPPDTSSSHSVLCPSPIITPPCSSLLLTTHTSVRNALKKNRARKAAGPDGISSRLLKSCADQLCGIFGYTVQPEPEAGESATALEDVLHHPSAKDTAPQGAQQLQAGSSDVSSDEDAGETGPRPSAPSWTRCSSPTSLTSGWMMPSSTSFTPPSLTWRRLEALWGRQRVQRTYSGLCGLVPAEQPPDQRQVKPRSWWWISAGVDHSPPAPVSIQGTDIDTVKSYKYLGVHLNDSLELDTQHRRPCQEGQQQTVPAQEAEVFWSAGTTPQDLL
ncbi:hypothetical protein L3Q82_023470 [Scortum barcoo]|uniref:Uncharacterized protein n=1 Tax=Scortum barcoo TaxID=214431 RepID=A0ACB8X017_9TELE|nr:hypothetical protein L3Q82_023470 [Scortum barcoo]